MNISNQISLLFSEEDSGSIASERAFFANIKASSCEWSFSNYDSFGQTEPVYSPIMKEIIKKRAQASSQNQQQQMPWDIVADFVSKTFKSPHTEILCDWEDIAM